MPRGKPIPDDVKERIYHCYVMGEKTKDLSERTGYALITIRRIIREQRKEHEKGTSMAHPEKTLKKDGNGGKLVAMGASGFMLTHTTADGKSHKKRLEGCTAHVAMEQYDVWCNNLDDECAFMNMVKRDPAEQPFVPTDEPLQMFEDETPEDEPADKKPSTDRTIADTELPEPKLDHWFNKNGSFAVVWKDKPVYLIWAKGEEPKCYGVYCTIEAALKELDKMNEVASFLGSENAFEVEEVVWR